MRKLLLLMALAALLAAISTLFGAVPLLFVPLFLGAIYCGWLAMMADTKRRVV